MPETAAEHRHTPYSSLRSAAEPEADKARGPSAPGTSPSEPDFLTTEADRLESFKQALFAAFLAAPKAGIPTALIDLAATYTSALKLQMTLNGLRAMPARAAKASVFPAVRGK
jgi:hypothetical protein